HYASWAARFDGDAARLLHTLRKAGAEQFVWVTLRHADRANTSSNHWGELNLYAWYFPYVNERLHLLDAQRNRLVLADWAHLGDRRGVTYDSIHLNSTGGHLMQLLIEKTIYREAHRQAASGATP
ncbi:MAG: hypothetical protein QOG68_1848, partial [Solirubrobacteraceae bacterium]|nr:hypothetical protein [Solirubrobacteraceae bacterium]